MLQSLVHCFLGFQRFAVKVIVSVSFNLTTRLQVSNKFGDFYDVVSMTNDEAIGTAAYHFRRVDAAAVSEDNAGHRI